MATARTNEGSEIESRYGKEFQIILVIQTGSGAHPGSDPLGVERFFLGGKVAGAWIWPLMSK
jgi:hypothetical protein